MEGEFVILFVVIFGVVVVDVLYAFPGDFGPMEGLVVDVIGQIDFAVVVFEVLEYALQVEDGPSPDDCVCLQVFVRVGCLFFFGRVLVSAQGGEPEVFSGVPLPPSPFPPSGVIFFAAGSFEPDGYESGSFLVFAEVSPRFGLWFVVVILAPVGDDAEGVSVFGVISEIFPEPLWYFDHCVCSWMYLKISYPIPISSSTPMRTKRT